MSNGDHRTIVITGIGLVTPLGIGRERTWQAIVAGRSGLRWRVRTADDAVPAGEPTRQPTSVAGVRQARIYGVRTPGASATVASAAPAIDASPRSLHRDATVRRAPVEWQRSGFAAGGPLPALQRVLARIGGDLRRQQKARAHLQRSCSPWSPHDSPFGVWHDLLLGDHPDRTVQAAVVAAAEALADAALGWDLTALGDRCGLVLGTSKGGIARVQTLLSPMYSPESGSSRAPFTDPHGPFPPDAADEDWWRELWRSVGPQTAAECVADLFGIRGPRSVPVAACATGLLAVAQAALWLRQGVCDVVVCGSADASLCDAVLASFQRLGVLASGFKCPEQAVRPFDASRNGFLVGEGAALLVMERAATASRRGRRPYARWLGEGWATDPSGLTAMDTSGSVLSHVVQDVLERANLSADRIDLVGFHGTATAINDICETEAIKTALGKCARRVRGFSLKPAVGHLLGAAGSVELAATLLALREQTVPPTLNLRDPDPRCDLDYTPQRARHCHIETALKLSLGFGGHVAAVAIGAWDE